MIGGRIYFITQNGRTSSTGTTFNGDGRFVICDAHTMKRILARDMPFYAQVASSSGTRSTLCWPQHIVAVSPEKGYIQYSTSDMESHSGIRTVNLVSGVIATTDIPDTYGVFTKTGATKARMTVSRGKVFAGRGNSVIVIDSATDQMCIRDRHGAVRTSTTTPDSVRRSRTSDRSCLLYTSRCV